MTSTAATATVDATSGASPWTTLLLATAGGLIVANLYYAQPLVGPISRSLGLSPGAGGLIVTLTQLGYGAGLLLVVPLGDLLDNRRLVLCLIGLGTIALLAATLSTHPLPFLVAALFVGLGSVAVQVLVPYAAHLAPEAVRGRAVGNVMSGLMLGIMLARPVSGFVAQLASWHAMFAIATAMMALVGLVLARALPSRRPASALGYGGLLASMAQLVRDTPILRRRAIYHAFLFAAFSLFWTATPLLLAGPAFRMSQAEIALFALAGVAGAIAAPIAGSIADRGWMLVPTALAMLAVGAAFLMTRAVPLDAPVSLALLVAAAIILDFGVTTNLVLGQRAIFVLGADLRSRLNGLFMATFFLGGAAGSALGAWSFAQGGWPLTAWVGTALPVAGLLALATERRPR